MDQRKLMDNANTITDMAKVRITVLTRGNCSRETREKRCNGERTEMKDED